MSEGDAHPQEVASGLPDDASEDEKRRHWLRWLAALFVVLFAAIWFIAYNNLPTLERIVAAEAAIVTFASDHLPFVLAAYIGCHALIAFLSIPGGSVLTIAGGLAFGGTIAGLATTAAAVLGSVIFFYLVRAALLERMRERVAKAGPRVTGLTDGFERNAFSLIVVMRLVPVIPYWLASGLPALFKTRARVFVAASFIGLLPWTVGFAFFGDALGDLIAAQDGAVCGLETGCEIDFSALTSGPVLTGLGLGILAIVPIAVNWFVNRRRWARLAP